MARLSVEERVQIRRLHKEGLPLQRIAKEMSRSWWAVQLVLRPTKPTQERLWSPSPARLSLADREEIRAGIAQGDSFTAIAVRIGRAVSTVSREVAANGGRERYRAVRAHRRAARCARRPKAAKLVAPSALKNQVEEWLAELWSPEQIARRLRFEHPGDPMMWVSHETIYQSLYVQGRGALKRELIKCLRTGRAQRRPRSRVEHRGRIPDMVMISERPPEIADRAVPGHWEGDLLMGAGGRSAVGTLVERSTRYVLLLHLDAGTGAHAVSAAMVQAIRRLPAELARSVTWDQGREMYRHRQFTIDTGVQVFFCDPQSPWQRGTNENTNGLLRQFLPKGTDLSTYSRVDLDEIERKLNGRPRETLGWVKPSERLLELIAATG